MSSRRFYLFILLSLIASSDAFINTYSKPKQADKMFMVKNSDRARLEKCFEDLMDNDWRVFRARLVAQERNDPIELSNKVASNRASQETSVESRDEKQVRQDKLGNIFAAIFSKRESDERKAPSSIFDDNPYPPRHGRKRLVTNLLIRIHLLIGTTRTRNVRSKSCHPQTLAFVDDVMLKLNGESNIGSTNR